MKAWGLLKQIDPNEVYMNAKGKEENEIKSALQLLDEAVMNDFMDIATCERATLVKETPEHVLQARLSQYSDSISACQAAAAPMRFVDSVGGCPCEGDGWTLQVTAGN